MTHPIIVIGAGLAGWTAAREFRKLDPSAPVTLVTADSGDFYAKPSLSNAWAQGRTPAQLVSTLAAKMAESLNITLLAHTRVEAIHPDTRSLSTTHGALHYSQLVLATGAHPIRVPIQGNAADQVMSINSLDDFTAFHARLTGSGSEKPQHVLIMGAGLIGCEFANDLSSAHYKVTVVDPSSGPIAALLPAQASLQLQESLAALGVRWHFGATVTSVNPTREAGSRALRVELSNGHIEYADIVLSAIGLRANTTMAQAAGLVCERGVVVDAILQTSAAHIYALGDSAQYASGLWSTQDSVSGGRSLPYVMPIMSAAKALAATLTGSPTRVVFPLMPIAIKTPALPIMVAAPPPGTPGDWHSSASGVWQFMDANVRMGGFVLTGKHTNRRAEQVKLLTA